MVDSLIDDNDLQRLIADARRDYERRRSDHERRNGNETLGAEDICQLVEGVIAEVLEQEASRRVGHPLTQQQDDYVAEEIRLRLIDGVIRLEALLRDPTVTDLHVKGNDSVVVKHDDLTESTAGRLVALDDDLPSLVQQLGRQFATVQRPFDFANPELSLRLHDGSRVFAVGFGVSARPYLVVRRNLFPRCTVRILADQGYFPHSMVSYFEKLVQSQATIFVTGGQGVGKTHFIRGLASAIPRQDVVVTIETDLELGIDLFPDTYPRTVYAHEMRRANVDGKGEIGVARIVAYSLRASAHRMILGEARGPEAWEFMSALGAGAKGSMASVHASDARQALNRFADLAMRSGQTQSRGGVLRELSDVVDIVVHLERSKDRAGGYVHEIHEVVRGIDNDLIRTNLLYPRPEAIMPTPENEIDTDPAKWPQRVEER